MTTDNTKRPAAGDPNDAPVAVKNHNFVQLQKGYLKNWRGLASKNPVAVQILFFLIENMGRTTNAVICSYQVLMEMTDTSKSTVSRAIKILKDDNWIQAVKVGSATAYAINEKVAWQAAKNQRQYAIFSATVVASESEQDSDFAKKAKEALKHIPVIDYSSETTIVNTEEKLPPPDQEEMDV